MKVADLQGTDLDVWAAHAAGEENPQISHPGGSCYVKNAHTISSFRPSAEWRHGGPIIERERIDLRWSKSKGKWEACHPIDQRMSGLYYADNPLTAAMRAFVSSKYGDEVPDVKGQ